jgi:tetraacyldisaccharide 4'-kinase
LNRVLAPLVPLYAAAAGARNLAYTRGWTPQRRLREPVVSIGNLSVGGSGKTPLTIRLAELLTERGTTVDVLSRGYGRRSSEVRRVNPSGTADEFGDEPLLIARATGLLVFVGPSRYAAGLLAEQGVAGPMLHLLDDGFQHRQLARDVDIVTLHRSDFEDRLLPAGRLRESFSSLSRAQILVLRGEDQELEAELRRRGWMQPVWWMERRLEVPNVKRVVAFCAIAREEEFFSGLRSKGVTLAALRAWRDHHTYIEPNIAELLELRRQHEAEAFVTTEKDSVRLLPEQRRVLESAAPLFIARLVVGLRDETAAMEQLCSLLTASSASGRAGRRYPP